MSWYLKVLGSYAVFSGRAGRKEYWWFLLVSTLIVFALSALGMLIDATWIVTLYGWAVLLPTLAVGARRLHDIGWSGWWLLLYLVPVLGGLALLVFFIQKGRPGKNKYGVGPGTIPFG